MTELTYKTVDMPGLEHVAVAANGRAVYSIPDVDRVVEAPMFTDQHGKTFSLLLVAEETFTGPKGPFVVESLIPTALLVAHTYLPADDRPMAYEEIWFRDGNQSNVHAGNIALAPKDFALAEKLLARERAEVFAPVPSVAFAGVFASSNNANCLRMHLDENEQVIGYTTPTGFSTLVTCARSSGYSGPLPRPNMLRRSAFFGVPLDTDARCFTHLPEIHSSHIRAETCTLLSDEEPRKPKLSTVEAIQEHWKHVVRNRWKIRTFAERNAPALKGAAEKAAGALSDFGSACRQFGNTLVEDAKLLVVDDPFPELAPEEQPPAFELTAPTEADLVPNRARKLTPEDVATIRANREQRTNRERAQEFGVSPSVISDVKTMKTYAHLP